MLNRLYLNGCFTHQDRTFTFEKGLTGVIGPNESGKSLITEMVRYALFGSRALRGKAEDYKKLHVELDFTVSGEDYTVVRKGSKVTLDGPVKVSGTKPVDEAIRRVLGYDLNVFDVANACNQGEVEALSNMTPANRKAMVDQTIGLTVLDQLIKFAGQEGNTLKREAEAMKNTLVEPLKPEGTHRPAVEIAAELAIEEALEKEKLQLEAHLSRVPRQPVAPEACQITATVEELKAYQDHRDTLQRSVTHLERQLKAIEPEAHSSNDLDEFESWMDKADAWNQKQKLLAQGHICCPECNHSWPVADLGDLAAVEEVNPPSMTRRDLAQHRARIGNTDQIASIRQALDELEVPADRSADLDVRKSFEAQQDVFQRQTVAWETYNETLLEKQTRLAEIPELQIDDLRKEHAAARDFERDSSRYEALLVQYQNFQAEIEEIQTKAADFLKAREIIQALKVSVKTHLLPSLNKVASALLTQMTGGERGKVEVDEDFEILVDDQRIGTLSGSGKAVANLSIRIALGQILTNRVFSVFMADEVDAAMDDERAEYTAEALRRLTKNIGQVILVTHKTLETNNMIELKK